MNSSNIYWFTDLNKDSLPIAGGKGANLGEMASAGLPVPEGFVVTTSAYLTFVRMNRLQAQIETLAASANIDSMESLDQISAQIRALFDHGAIPSVITASIADAYRKLGSGSVAVRSSATAEDLPTASFAGQQETYLNIEGNDGVIEAVRRCWSSLWTARALAYRIRQQIRPDDVSLAVVLQRLVPARTAGVLFTTNPLNGRRDQMVIDGSWGLGEAVVSGEVSPDHWVVRAATGEVIERTVSRKLSWVVKHPGGTRVRPVPMELQDQPCLTDIEISVLAALGRQVADHYGCPQDIEWAITDQGSVALLQTRPITSLFPDLDPPVPEDRGLRLYVCFNTLQGLAEPLTPAGISAFQMAGCAAGRFLRMEVEPGKIPPAMKSAAGRLYLDATNPLTYQRTKKLLLFMSSLVDQQTSSLLHSLIENNPSLKERPGAPFRINLSLLLNLVGRISKALI
ncbi:MAG: PEP/pyruvate-binding domain-containing protein, partial [Bacillota bacterium]